MATLKFFTRTIAKKNKLAPLYCRFVIGRGADFVVRTGIMIRPEFFSNKTGQLLNKTEFTDYKKSEKQLRDLRNHLFDQAAKLKEKPDKAWMLKAIDSFHNPDKEKAVTLFTFIQEFIDNAPTRTTPKTGSPVCYKQLREYERTFHYMKGYAAEKGRKLNFNDVDLDFYHEFIEYLQGLKLAKNTIGKKIQTLKIFLNAATDNGINTNRQFKSHRFTAISEETESIYLNETELRAIDELNIENPKLDRVRDLFLIGCWTGLRYSDWNKITPENIDNGFLELRQAKTGGKVVIPLHPTVTAIMGKYNGELPKVISNQKFNDYLKDVAQLAGIKEKVHKTMTKGGTEVSKSYPKYKLVTTHTARRSFATNLYNADFPTLSIMQITGHKTEQAFLKYIKVTPREHAQKLKEFWRDQVKLKIV